MDLSIHSGVMVHVFQSEDKYVQQKCSKMLENTCKKEVSEWKLSICVTNAVDLDLNWRKYRRPLDDSVQFNRSVVSDSLQPHE